MPKEGWQRGAQQYFFLCCLEPSWIELACASCIASYVQFMDKAKQLEGFIASLEQEAYRRGIADTLAVIIGAATHLAEEHSISIGVTAPTSSEQSQPRQRRRRMPRRDSYQARVLAEIKRNIGLRGVEIVEALAKSDKPVPERTMRTALRRLRDAGQIEQRADGRWYSADPNRPTLTHPPQVPDVTGLGALDLD